MVSAFKERRPTVERDGHMRRLEALFSATIAVITYNLSTTAVLITYSLLAQPEGLEPVICDLKDRCPDL